ncbi:hypothetical protein AAC387_Pa01g2172 [Persea americana]
MLQLPSIIISCFASSSMVFPLAKFNSILINKRNGINTREESSLKPLPLSFGVETVNLDGNLVRRAAPSVADLGRLPFKSGLL